MPHLPNGHQVILRDFGHTTDVWTEQTRASTHLINTYLDHGKVDTSLDKHRKIDFEPSVTQPALAKGLAGSMVVFALITVLSLLWMPRRVKKRGRIGARKSVLLRSLFPLVLGFGGWFLVALILMTAAPGVPLDGELLVVFSMGIPIALGIYWAWLQRDWPAETKRVGLAAAALSALVGGWLGFHAGADMLALVTTIAGATAATNLALILVSVARERGLRPETAPRRSESRSPLARVEGVVAHSILPESLTPAAGAVLEAAGVRHVAHGVGDVVQAAGRPPTIRGARAGAVPVGGRGQGGRGRTGRSRCWRPATGPASLGTMSPAATTSIWGPCYGSSRDTEVARGSPM